jgi:hypothetical protein
VRSRVDLSIVRKLRGIQQHYPVLLLVRAVDAEVSLQLLV